jgi:uncharacterized protein YbaR (Trm112 family)
VSGRIDPELLAILICPRCGGDPLEVRRAPGGEEEALECRRCGVAYPVEDGIPVMLVDEAKPIPGAYVKDPVRQV